MLVLAASPTVLLFAAVLHLTKTLDINRWSSIFNPREQRSCEMESSWGRFPEDFVAILVAQLAAAGDRCTLKKLRQTSRHCRCQVDSNLQYIKLNYVADGLRRITHQFSNLTQLDLTRVSPNQSLCGLSTLQKLKSLKLNGWLRSLSMAGHEDDASVIQQLSHLSSLTYVEGLVVRSAGLLALKGLTSLRSLKLHTYSNRFYGSHSADLSLGVLTSLQKLTTLSLVACELGGELGNLASHPTLTNLTLDNCRDLDFSTLHTLTYLKSLQLLDLQLLDKEAIQLSFLTALTMLTHLHVCEPFTFSDQSYLLHMLPTSLKQLDYHVSNDQDETWYSALECFNELTRLSELTSLDMPETVGLIDSGILMPVHFPKMRKLGLDCRDVTGARLRSLAALTTLSVLNLHSMEDAQQGDVIALASSLPHLSKLLLLDFHDMTSHCWSALKSLPSVTSIVHSRNFGLAWTVFRMSPVEPAFCPVLDPTTTFNPLGSFIGGHPFWTQQHCWPICESCHRAELFFLQINLATTPLAVRCGDLMLQLFACPVCAQLHALFWHLSDRDKIAVEDWYKDLKTQDRDLIGSWKAAQEDASKQGIPGSYWRSHGLVEVLESFEQPNQLGLSHSWPPELSELPEILSDQTLNCQRTEKLINRWTRCFTGDSTGYPSSSPTVARLDFELHKGKGASIPKTLQIGGYKDPFCNVFQVMHSHIGHSHKSCPVCSTPMCFRLCSVSTNLFLKLHGEEDVWESLHTKLCSLGRTSFELCSCPYHTDQVVMQCYDQRKMEHIFLQGVEWLGKN